MAAVSENMARQTLSGLLRTWRRHQRGEWKWLLLSLGAVILLTVLLHTDGMLQERQLRVRVIDIGRVGGQLSDDANLTLQILQVGKVESAQTLQYYERRVVESYLRVQLALTNSSRLLVTQSAGVDQDRRENDNVDQGGLGRPKVTQGNKMGLGRLQVAQGANAVGTLSDLQTFQPLLSAREKARLLYAFELFSATCKVAGLSYFLVDNSLLGSVRHHGITPWSDYSVSVGMRREDQNRVLRVLDNLVDMTLFWPNPYEWSLRLKDVKPDPPDLVRMTFIHINFYRQNDTHIWGETWGGARTFTAPTHKVFPLVKRPFEGWLVPTPCDTTSIMAAREVGTCHVQREDQWEMEWRDAEVVPCDALKQVFPFVTRHDTAASRTVTEQLSVNGTLLYSVDVERGCVDVK